MSLIMTATGANIYTSIHSPCNVTRKHSCNFLKR